MGRIVSWCLKGKSVARNTTLLLIALRLAGGGSQLISSSLALTVIGGLATSTFLTLLVVPVGYSPLEGFRARRKKKYVR